MKHFFLLFILLLPNAGNSQLHYNSDSLADVICDCILLNVSTVENTEDVFRKCVERNPFQFTEEQFLAIEDTTMTPREQGLIIGDSMGKNLRRLILTNCETWAQSVYETREKSLKDMTSQSYDQKITFYKNELKKNDTQELHAALGMSYLGNSQMSKAKKQLKICLSYPEISDISYYFGGLYYELNHNLKKSLEFVEEAYEQTKSLEYFTLKTMIERKIKLTEN